MKKRWSLSLPMVGVCLTELAEVAREAQKLGYSDTWSSEVDGIDAFSPLAIVANSTDMRVGTAIVNAFTRGPQTMAACAAGLAEAAPGRFVLGIGSGSQPIVERWNGIPFQRPVTRVREMSQFLRDALTGEKVSFHGKTIEVQGFRLSAPPSEVVPIYVAALGPGMLSMAGETADGVILNWLSAEDVKQSVATVRRAADAAGRDPSRVEVLARLIVNIDPVGDESDATLKRSVTTYLNVPTYRKFHEWLGRREELGPMFAAWDSGDRRAALDAVPVPLINELIVRGGAEERRARVREYMEAGVDTVFLSFATSEVDPERRRIAVLNAMREMSPSAY